MSIEVKVPGFPESVTEGTIAAWHKQPGETVKRGETLVDIETDKVVFEQAAPEDGVLEEILEKSGAKVVSGQIIARLGAGMKAAANEPAKAVAAASVRRAETDASSMSEAAPLLAPAAEKLIVEHSLDSSQISGSGRNGRVLKEDVLRFLKESPAPQPVPAPPLPQIKTPLAAEAPLLDQERPEKRVPMTRLRARIAERLVEAQQTAAILTTFNEVNMQPVMELRQRYREQFEKAYGIRLGFMSFFVKAAVEALKRFPEINASIDGDDIVYHGFYDIGIAVASPRGLVVPILRDADRLSMAEIEARIADYASKAQNKTLGMEDITGGTFTITNGGVFGSLLSTPILNPPQSGILGMHKTEKRPVVENDEIVIRPMMYVALSYDHRLVDGREAVQFLVAIKEVLEDPARILLEI